MVERNMSLLSISELIELQSLPRQFFQVINPDDIENGPPFSSISPGHQLSGHVIPILEPFPWGFTLLYSKTGPHIFSVHIDEGNETPLCCFSDINKTLIVTRGVLILEVCSPEQEVIKYSLSEGLSWHIPRGTPHRMIALEDLIYIEICTNSNNKSY